jgi:calmodulin
MADKLTEEQIAAFKETFSLLDADDGGTLSKEELTVVIEAMGQDPANLDELIHEVKADVEEGVDPELDFPEFLALMSRSLQAAQGGGNDEAKNAEMTEVFKTIAGAGNEFITKAQLRSLFFTLGEKLTDAEMKDMITGADQDGDNKISFEDFKNVIES